MRIIIDNTNDYDIGLLRVVLERLEEAEYPVTINVSGHPGPLSFEANAWQLHHRSGNFIGHDTDGKKHDIPQAFIYEVTSE
jgi:hypothetical protein